MIKYVWLTRKGSHTYFAPVRTSSLCWRSGAKSQLYHFSQMLCAQKRIIRGTSHERAVSSLWRDEKKRILVFFLHRVFLLSRDKIRLVNCLFIMKLHQSWKFHGLFVCFPPEAFKTQCFSIFVTSKINYRQSRKSSNCKIQQRYLLLLCSCRSLLGSTLVIEDLFYLSYTFHLLFLCWATFHYSFMQPKFLLEKK